MLKKCFNKLKIINKSIRIASIITLVFWGIAPKAEAVTENPCGVVAAWETCLDFEGITGVNLDGIAPLGVTSGADIPSNWTLNGDNDGWWVSNDINAPQDTNWGENIYLLNPAFLTVPLTIGFGGDILDIISMDLIILNDAPSQNMTLSGEGLGGFISQNLQVGSPSGTSHYSSTDLGLLGILGITSLTFNSSPFGFALDNFVFTNHVSAVPEPSSIVLMVAGMATILAYRKRKIDN